MKKYSIWSHYRYLYSELWRYDSKLFLLSILECILRAAKPFIAVVLPAFIVGLLEQGVEVKTLVFSCLGAFLVSGILLGVAECLEQPNWTGYIFVRLEKFWSAILYKCIDMDYVLFEKEEVQKDVNYAFNAINSNRDGVEGFYHQNVNLFSSILGITIYSLLLAKVHPLLILFLLVLSLVQYIFHRIAENYEEKNRDEQSKRYMHQQYLFRQSADVKNGKDVRLFQLQDWLTSLFLKYNKEYQKQLSKNERLFYVYDFVGLVLNLFRDALCYGYLIYLLTQGMSVSKFVLYLGVVGGFGSWFQQISTAVAELSRCMKQINHYRDFMDMKNVYLRDEGKELKTQKGIPFDIVFEDVSFMYPGTEKPVLEHISFHL